jgi:DNA-binding NarL/FixJ family response regulator
MNPKTQNSSGGEGNDLGETLPRVLIASDVRLCREGLAASLIASGRLGVAGTVAGSDLTVACISRLRPDVVLLDMALAGCLLLPAALRAEFPVKFVAFAVSEIDDDILACAEAGISGYIGKDGSAEDVVATIERAICDELLCSRRIASALFQRLAVLAQPQAGRSNVDGLTGREREIIDLIDKGHSNKEIALRLKIAAATVKNHVHNILEKLGVHRRAAAAAAVRGSSGEVRGDGPPSIVQATAPPFVG